MYAEGRGVGKSARRSKIFIQKNHQFMALIAISDPCFVPAATAHPRFDLYGYIIILDEVHAECYGRLILSMPNQNNDRKTARPRSRKLIEDMLQERQQMLVLLWELSKLDLAAPDESTRETLDDFQEILVDYIAAAHFGLYQRIAEGSERRQAVLDVARETYPRIARSTDLAVEFTEKYDSAAGTDAGSGLTTHLSLLAEELTSRIELEDRLILALVGPDFDIPKVSARA